MDLRRAVAKQSPCILPSLAIVGASASCCVARPRAAPAEHEGFLGRRHSVAHAAALRDGDVPATQPRERDGSAHKGVPAQRKGERIRIPPCTLSGEHQLRSSPERERLRAGFVGKNGRIVPAAKQVRAVEGRNHTRELWVPRVREDVNACPCIGPHDVLEVRSRCEVQQPAAATEVEPQGRGRRLLERADEAVQNQRIFGAAV
mmetsp:Transcript_9469/g.31387  ORF Transcript_9469/g.31387 Transcript_9469/m.31387 type:complete len:203 (-) Transcript_9469:15-623(-)